MLEAQHNVGKVRGMRAADVNDLNVLVLHELLVAAVRVLHAELGGESTSRIYCTTGNSDDLGVLKYIINMVYYFSIGGDHIQSILSDLKM